MSWQPVCKLDQITPGTGVCALINGEQVALFRPTQDGDVFALSNIDPFAQSSVLSRGLVGESQGVWYVASPLKKQRFDLATGQCLDDEGISLKSFKTKIDKKQVFVSAK